MLQEIEELKVKLSKHFRRLNHLTTQIPTELREILTFRYMRYNNFKSILLIDKENKIGFEIIRERGSKTSIKVKKTSELAEKEICGIFGSDSLFKKVQQPYQDMIIFYTL